MFEKTSTVGQQANDYSNYAWVNGVFMGDAVCVSTDQKGNVYVGAKGYDKKHGKTGYISVKFDDTALEALHKQIVAVRLTGKVFPEA